MKYLVYVRKSTEQKERQALSINAQIAKIEEVFKNVELVKPYIKEEKSAFKPGRPKFNEMIKRLHKGEADGIIAWHPDRLARNERDAADITAGIREGTIKDLKFGSYTFEASPEGIMMLQITMSQSQYSSAKLSKDVKRGLETKLKRGWKPGFAPTGYLNNTRPEKGLRTIYLDKKRAPIVRKMWDLMLTGNYSVPEILKIANEDWGYETKKVKKVGGKPLSRSALYGIFTNPFYKGYFRHNGKEIEGRHPALVTAAEFQRVQDLLGRRSPNHSQKRDITYRGPLNCGECGCKITAEVKSKLIKSTGLYKIYTYYHCTKKRPCTQKGFIEETELEKQLLDLVNRVSIIPEFRDWAIEVIKSQNDKEIMERSKIQDSLNDKINSTQKQLDQLTQMKMRELLDDDEYMEQKNILKAKLADQRHKLSDSVDKAMSWLELGEELFNFAANANQRFVNGDAETRKNILSSLGTVIKLQDGLLSVEYSAWLKAIDNGYKPLETELLKVRTDNSLDSSLKKTQEGLIRSSWLPIQVTDYLGE